ncbi:MAG: hypothetical protein ACJ8AO_10370, partial [Gemmatimonadaceae bacterium]
MRSFIAQQRDLGRMVLVHLFEPDKGDAGRLQALLDRLGPEERAKVIEVGEVGGSRLVVTQYTADFTSFRAWLEARVSEAGTVQMEAVRVPSTIVPPSAPAVPPPALRAPPVPQRPPSATPPPAAAPAPAPASAPPASGGSFTQLFAPGEAAPAPRTPNEA